VLEVTVRSTADLLGIQPNSAALFYRKPWEVIAYYLEQGAHEIFDGAVELDESYFGGVRKIGLPQTTFISFSYNSHLPQRKAGVCTGASQCWRISSSSKQTVTDAPAISNAVVYSCPPANG